MNDSISTPENTSEGEGSALRKAHAASHAPARTPGIERRTLVKGAAWSLPVIALAVGTPARAASADWNISLAANCLVGVVGVGVIPGYSIHETSGKTPTLSPLTFVETYQTVIPLTWSGANIAHAAIKLVADTFANALALVFLTTGSIGGKSAGITIGGWSAFTGVESNIVQVGGAIGGHGSSTMTYTATRTVTVVGMTGGGTMGYGYVAGLTFPSLGSGLTASNTSNLTAIGGSGGVSSGDDSATMSASLLTSTCS